MPAAAGDMFSSSSNCIAPLTYEARARSNAIAALV